MPEPTTTVTGDEHYQRNLHLVTAGVKSRAPGIRRCRDCKTPFIAGTTNHTYCPTCRPNHHQHCRRCTREFPIDDLGVTLCPICCTHLTLF
jgi:uncharacterized Zn ribbon protein